jgi:hypothetical protein
MILCHPALYYLLELEERGEDLKRWISELTGSIDIDGADPVTKEEIEYYYRKYQILKQNGHFVTSGQENRLSLRFKATDVDALLANVAQVTLETTEACNLQCMGKLGGKIGGGAEKLGAVRVNVQIRGR